jgi:RNA recognition motif-containing protein
MGNSAIISLRTRCVPSSILPLPAASPALWTGTESTPLGDIVQVKTAKIIRDRDDKPKGFGYVEFTTLDGLKNALSMSMSQLAGRSIRVSVADAREYPHTNCRVYF